MYRRGKPLKVGWGMELMNSILILGGDPHVRENLAQTFGQKDFEVNTAGSVYDAFQLLKEQEFDMLCVDINTYVDDNIALLDIVRYMHPEMPILALIPRNGWKYSLETVRQVIRDYLLKPGDQILAFSRAHEIMEEINPTRREQAILSEVSDLLDELKDTYEQADGEYVRMETEGRFRQMGRYLRCGPFVLDIHSYRILHGEEIISLTSSNFNYFLTLARHAPDPVPYDALVQESRGCYFSSEKAKNITHWRIYQLRKLIEPNPQHPRYILTVRGYGYRLSTTEGSKAADL
jgi:two-component system alkaline phosphatase synthesis response regulator PhoP